MHGGKRKGAGRKPQNCCPKRKISITIAENLLTKVDESEECRSEIIERAIALYFKHNNTTKTMSNQDLIAEIQKTASSLKEDGVKVQIKELPDKSWQLTADFSECQECGSAPVSITKNNLTFEQLSGVIEGIGICLGR